MGWFDEQIKIRKENDEKMLSDAYYNVAAAVSKKLTANAISDSQKAKNAINEILAYFHIKNEEFPAEIEDIEEQLESILRPHGIMKRVVKLSAGWTKDATGPMLSTRKSDESVVALIPGAVNGYTIFDAEKGSRLKIDTHNENLISEEAYVFYKPFPLRKINIRDILTYSLTMLTNRDKLLVPVTFALITGVGMIGPILQKILFSQVVESKEISVLAAMSIFMICVVISRNLINSVNNCVLERIKIKNDMSIQAAIMMRILSLPTDFFKKYSSGELSTYSQNFESLIDIIIQTTFINVVAALCSLVYIGQIFVYAKGLVIPAMVVIALTLFINVIVSLFQMNLSKQTMKYSAKENGIAYSLILGIQKIKLAGAEKRAFSKWANAYANNAKLMYNPPAIIKLNNVFNMIINSIGSIIIYYIAVKSKVSVSDYCAFIASYGMVSAAFMQLAAVSLSIAQIKPILDVIKPIMEEVPEISENKQVITRLSGNIELNNVSFKYNENMPNVVDNMTLKIRSGQYVAIVGKTGCGKSTLVRLLLGFEKPQKGAIYYDGKNLEKLDLKSLRRKIGVVLQNGKLFQGDIFSNIVISAPWLTLEDAWEAARMSGMDEDIMNMPMGMNTLISEGQGGISGGQKQRLMIARAIVTKPSVLIFDEATSALDNITQKKVSDSLDNLKCTRIVIAHRLSTIKQCDRIIVLDKGKIIEDGTYKELIEKNGYFAEFVERQRIDT